MKHLPRADGFEIAPMKIRASAVKATRKHTSYMAQSSGKKSAAKKTGMKKTGAKKPAATKKRTVTKTGGVPKTRKPSLASLRRQQTQAEEDRAQYMRKIEANQSRLVSGNAADGTPLTPAQITATENILTVQRQKLDELDALEESFAELNAEEDPRLAQV
ncbi:MAG: hypothetical protein MSG64_11135 [Pyrinomonadaceae bacterium MAG19_C2-C3]|nr:hypothetical protein [Pyrinomonadaceae bacterium MAG19_C2-C3]